MAPLPKSVQYPKSSRFRRTSFSAGRHDTDGGLGLFEMTVPPTGRMPASHFHRDWDETVYGLSGMVTLYR
jgi:hypothetical protein